MNESECPHEKVYSLEAFMCIPPSHQWCCGLCGATGHEALPVGIRPDEVRYRREMGRWHADDPYWRQFARPHGP